MIPEIQLSFQGRLHTRFVGCQTLASNNGWVVYVAEGRDFVA